MPIQERDEQCQINHDEKWQTGDTGRLSVLRDQDVQNRQEIRPIKQEDLIKIRLDISITEYPAFLCAFRVSG
jgi:hypothetical protein